MTSRKEMYLAYEQRLGRQSCAALDATKIYNVEDN